MYFVKIIYGVEKLLLLVIMLVHTFCYQFLFSQLYCIVMLFHILGGRPFFKRKKERSNASQVVQFYVLVIYSKHVHWFKKFSYP